MYILIPATALTITGPAAAPKKENPDKPNILAAFGQAQPQPVYLGGRSLMPVSRRGVYRRHYGEKRNDGPW